MATFGSFMTWIHGEKTMEEIAQEKENDVCTSAFTSWLRK